MEKSLKKFAIPAVFLGIAGAACAHAEADVSRDGGNVIVMRHATSPSGQNASVGMTEGCELQPGRGLNTKGFAEARFIGEWLAANGARIDRTYTSDICRCWDTARLVAAAGAGPVIPRAEMKSDDPTVANAFKREIETELAASPRSNILLVTHSNITPLYWAGPKEGEEETPSGRAHVVRRLSETAPNGDGIWAVVSIDFVATLTVDSKPLGASQE